MRVQENDETSLIVSIVLMFVFVHNPNDYVIYGAISVISASSVSFAESIK